MTTYHMAYWNAIIKEGGGGVSYKKWIFAIVNFYEGWIYKCSTHQKYFRSGSVLRGHDPYCLQGSTGSGFRVLPSGQTQEMSLSL